MHLLIFDPHDRGHYLAYVKHMLSGVPTQARTTLALRKGASESVPFQQQLLPHIGGVNVDDSIRPDSYGNGSALLEDFTAAVARHRPDHVWIPSGDLLFKTATLERALRRWRMPAQAEVECGLIEIRCHRSPTRLRGHLRTTWDRLLIAAGRWATLFTIDPTVTMWAQARGGTLAKRLRAMPDPVEPIGAITKVDARSALGIPLEGRYVTTVGVHAVPRKGTQLLVEAFARAPLAPTDRLLIAGPLGDALRARLDSQFAHLLKNDRIVVVDRYLGEVELIQALAAADLVCTPYIDHMGSSAVVLQAARVGRPVLAPHQGWFGEMIPRFGLGDTGAILAPESLAAALGPSLDRSGAYATTASASRLLAYSDAANFGRLWSSRIRERLGLAQDPGLRTWDWVMQADTAR